MKQKRLLALLVMISMLMGLVMPVGGRAVYAAPDGEEVQTEPDEETITWMPGDALSDSDLLFADYANSLFYPAQEQPMLRSSSSNNLYGADLELYEALRSMVIDIANGDRASTEEEITISDASTYGECEGRTIRHQRYLYERSVRDVPLPSGNE